MRRALLLATLVAAPALAAAQTGIPAAGTITFTNTDADPSAQTINLAECSGAPGTHAVEISWNTTGTSPGGNITFQLFASNKASASTANCPTQPDTGTSTTAVAVGQITSQSTLSAVNQTFDPSVIASALTTGGNYACSLPTDTTIYLCVNAVNALTGQVIGSARGQMTLSLWRPDVSPVLSTPIPPGDGGLSPSWSANGTTNTQWYRVQAVSVANPASLPGPAAFDPGAVYSAWDPRDTTRHFSDYVSGTQVRVGGLVNGVTYAVAVVGYTPAFNPSAASNVGSGMPEHVNDFWQIYKGAGGQETGGCASGAAGPLALALLAGVLALSRRRK